MSEAEKAFDLVLDEMDEAQIGALLKIVTMFEDAKISPDEQIRLVAFGIASWEFPAVREVLAAPMPTESPDVLTLDELRTRPVV